MIKGFYILNLKVVKIYSCFPSLLYYFYEGLSWGIGIEEHIKSAVKTRKAFKIIIITWILHNF